MLLKASNVRNLTEGATKLLERRHGPFRISKVTSAVNYKLDLPSSWRRVNPVFHVSQLEPYRESDQFPDRVTPPPPPELDKEGQQTWQVAAIVGKRCRNINWKGSGLS